MYAWRLRAAHPTRNRQKGHPVAEIFYDDSADLSLVQRRHVAVLGYGSQGHAHALSLRDSGVDVRVGLPAGSASREKAGSDGLRVLTPAEACEEADLVMVLIPDHLQRAVYAEAIAPSLVEGDALFFAHGLNWRRTRWPGAFGATMHTSTSVDGWIR